MNYYSTLQEKTLTKKEWFAKNRELRAQGWRTAWQICEDLKRDLKIDNSDAPTLRNSARNKSFGFESDKVYFPIELCLGTLIAPLSQTESMIMGEFLKRLTDIKLSKGDVISDRQTSLQACLNEFPFTSTGPKTDRWDYTSVRFDQYCVSFEAYFFQNETSFHISVRDVTAGKEAILMRNIRTKPLKKFHLSAESNNTLLTNVAKALMIDCSVM